MRTDSLNAWTPCTPELCDGQCLKIESTAPLCSPLPRDSSRCMKSCPRLAALWVSGQPVSGSVSRSQHGELKRLSGVGRSSAQRQERRGREGEKLKNNHKENKLFFEIGNFKEKIYEPLGLWNHLVLWSLLLVKFGSSKFGGCFPLFKKKKKRHLE